MKNLFRHGVTAGWWAKRGGFGLIATLAFAGTFSAPAANDAAQYPAHDSHARELAAVAADPYDTAAKNEIFSNSYLEHGFLPVFVVVTNRGALPLALTGMQVELDFDEHTRVLPANEEELIRRMAEPSRPGPRPIPLPIPLPRRKNKKSMKIAEEFQAAEFGVLAVEPQTSRGGFFFFDVSGISIPLGQAHVIVSRIRDGAGHELFYFDIPLARAVAAPATTTGQD